MGEVWLETRTLRVIQYHAPVAPILIFWKLLEMFKNSLIYMEKVRKIAEKVHMIIGYYHMTILLCKPLYPIFTKQGRGLVMANRFEIGKIFHRSSTTPHPPNPISNLPSSSLTLTSILLSSIPHFYLPQTLPLLCLSPFPFKNFCHHFGSYYIFFRNAHEGDKNSPIGESAAFCVASSHLA